MYWWCCKLNKKAGVNWQVAALILAVILLIVLIGIVLFTEGKQSEIFLALKRIVWFT